MRSTTLALLLSLAAVAPVVSLSLRATAEPSPDRPGLGSPSLSSSALTTAAASSSTAAASVPSGSSSAPGPHRRRTVGQRLASEPLPDSPTPMPPLKDWKGLEDLDPDQGSSNCDLHVQGDWLQLHCRTGSIVDVSLLAGDSGKDVALTLIDGEFGNNDGSAIVRLRRGRSLVVTMTSVMLGRYSSGLPETTALLFVTWREGETRPTVRLEHGSAS